jgi:hypothetical protein
MSKGMHDKYVYVISKQGGTVDLDRQKPPNCVFVTHSPYTLLHPARRSRDDGNRTRAKKQV